MNNKTITIIFIAVVAIVLGVGIWYNNQSNQAYQQQQAAQGQQAQQEAAQQQQQTQQQLQKAMNDLKITDATVGTGATVKQGDTVNVLYAGSLDDGTVFDASSKHGNQPFSFTVGAGNVIQGWDLGLVGMKVGGKRDLVIPSDLGYGPGGSGPIPPNATLHFTIQLLSIATSTGQ
jgi:FKBP-type peptidyl-prolyl cis-trans isomerase